VHGGARLQRHEQKGRDHVDRRPADGGSAPLLSRAEARALFHRRKANIAVMRAVLCMDVSESCQAPEAAHASPA
jgi:hypothetical protein